MANPVATATVSSTALTLASGWNFTTDQISAARAIRVTSMTDNVSFLSDGSTPTSTRGHRLQAGHTFEMSKQNDTPQNIQIIRVTSDTVVCIELVTD